MRHAHKFIIMLYRHFRLFDFKYAYYRESITKYTEKLLFYGFSKNKNKIQCTDISFYRSGSITFGEVSLSRRNLTLFLSILILLLKLFTRLSFTTYYVVINRLPSNCFTKGHYRHLKNDDSF